MPIALGVPGPWTDRADLLAAMLANRRGPGRFVMAGDRLLDVVLRTHVGLELYASTPDLVRSFEVAGAGRVPQEVLDAVAAHRTTAWVVEPNRSAEAARGVVDAATALLDAGGLGVKVEAAGVSHAPDRWRAYARRGVVGLLDALVTVFHLGDEYRTSGLSQLGLPDVAVSDTAIGPREVTELLGTVARWLWFERPRLVGGDLFAVGLDAPRWELHRRPASDDGSLLANPSGSWELRPTARPWALASGLGEGAGPRFVALPEGDPEVARAAHEARATVGRLVQFCADDEPGRALVKLKLVEGAHRARMWTLVEAVRGDAAEVAFFELPDSFPEHRARGRATVPLGAIEDWAIVRYGGVVGGFSLRLVRERLPPEARRHHDLFTGFLSFAPLDELAAWRCEPSREPLSQ